MATHPARTSTRPSARSLHAASDERLIELARSRRADAIEEIMRRNNRRLFRAAYAVLGNEADAEDAVQDAYIKAFTGVAGFAARTHLSAWLTRIAVNTAIDRRRRQRPGVSLSVVGEDGVQAAVDAPSRSAEPPEHAAARDELRRLVEHAIDELPEAFRTVFVLRAVEEFSVAETARILGLPGVTVKTRLFRAKRRLQRSLRDEIDGALGDAFPFAGARCDRLVARVLRRLSERTPPDT